MEQAQVYARPRSIAEATALLASSSGARIIAGGTDLYPAHVDRSLPPVLVDVSAIPTLRQIAVADHDIRIGAAITWAELTGASLPPAFDGLRAAAREVGAIQIQNRGTIAGNLCNASPAADGVPPLLTLGASVEIVSTRGQRLLPLEAFITGYRQTDLKADEMVAAIVVPKPAPGARGAFSKLGARRYLVISIIMAAAVITRHDDGRIAEARVAVGAASPVAVRLRGLEDALVGLAPDRPPSSVLRPSHLEQLSPIDDVRAVASYRMEAALECVADVIDRAGLAAAHG